MGVIPESRICCVYCQSDVNGAESAPTGRKSGHWGDLPGSYKVWGVGKTALKWTGSWETGSAKPYPPMSFSNKNQ